MVKRIVLLLSAVLMLATVAHAQTPLKRCAGGQTVSVNQYCPEEYSQGSGGGGGSYAPPTIQGALVHAKGTTRFFAKERYSYSDRAAAVALEECQRVTRKECVVDMYFERGQCYAAAADNRYYGTAIGKSVEEAKQRALRTCTGTNNLNCRVVFSGCYQ